MICGAGMVRLSRQTGNGVMEMIWLSTVMVKSSLDEANALGYSEVCNHAGSNLEITVYDWPNNKSS